MLFSDFSNKIRKIFEPDEINELKVVIDGRIFEGRALFEPDEINELKVVIDGRIFEGRVLFKPDEKCLEIHVDDLKFSMPKNDDDIPF